ncbi:lipopolysaccharide export system protein LptA [Thiohalospira halophila DSM 15071]|uniref:Lipopolysaccharide export system protein LptA n=1 Tax=Thiohalospira halophila DSM 15071 TaxID=1123397 RepID=A0A1I1QUX1_9GAMM|nr:lipopolysaccharide transport periplasmic protein LptA [Thiohalospira halophila]SFD25835.1 lipopolysaccharide export system protein LptA [Thiohalospira halophila DSM 15071]
MSANRLLALLLLTALATPLAAQELDVVSDEASLDQGEGVATFRGDVEATRGKTRLTGAWMRVEQVPSAERDGEETGLRRLELEGDPARLFHTSEEGEELRGRARRIVYRAGPERLDLHGDAVLERGQDRFAGDHIRYFLETDRVEGRGGDQGGRVRTTLFPEGNGDEEGGEAPVEGTDNTDDEGGGQP